jgi:hypothetical protein
MGWALAKEFDFRALTCLRHARGGLSGAPGRWACSWTAAGPSCLHVTRHKKFSTRKGRNFLVPYEPHSFAELRLERRLESRRVTTDVRRWSVFFIPEARAASELRASERRATPTADSDTQTGQRTNTRHKHAHHDAHSTRAHRRPCKLNPKAKRKTHCAHRSPAQTHLLLVDMRTVVHWPLSAL